MYLKYSVCSTALVTSCPPILLVPIVLRTAPRSGEAELVRVRTALNKLHLYGKVPVVISSHCTSNSQPNPFDCVQLFCRNLGHLL
ncbi:hypothetical protein V8C37DRAFT_364045 [Trichoderma ceciliae]